MAPSKQSSGLAIVRFYDPDVQAKDSRGRTQEQILAWNNSQLENSHNYIQMLFPLPEGSPYNWEAPVIDLEAMEAFRARSELRQRLRMSFKRMLTFYGFITSIHPEESEEKQETEESHVPPATSGVDAVAHDTNTLTNTTETPSNLAERPKSSSTSQASPFEYLVVCGPNWRKASRNWCVRFDHNHLRITRILRCLRVLGLQTECDAFFTALKDVYNDPSVSISERTMEFWTRAVERPLYIAPDNDEVEWLKMWEAEQVNKE
ncbi:hypothetical protein EJ07DRAFT_100101 [Lizonia empirigonia]|nr:hypothetical protein EJ07DRAFT_100101 [Lizonia empirigonia]